MASPEWTVERHLEAGSEHGRALWHRFAELVAAIDKVHAEVWGETPARDVTRWFSDASALTRYGVPTVNYGTSTGLMDVELGENLEIDALVKTAEVYARVAMEVCGRA